MRDFISNLAIFKSLNSSGLDDILSIIQEKTFSKGDNIVTFKDSEDKDLYIIAEGSAVVKIYNSGIENANIFALDKGHIFGELALVTNQNRNATIEATEETKVLIITKCAFEEIAEKNTRLGMIVYRNLCGVIADRVEKTNRLLLHTIKWGW